jgi:hypothetical protein
MNVLAANWFGLAKWPISFAPHCSPAMSLAMISLLQQFVLRHAPASVPNAIIWYKPGAKSHHSSKMIMID